MLDANTTPLLGATLLLLFLLCVWWLIVEWGFRPAAAATNSAEDTNDNDAGKNSLKLKLTEKTVEESNDNNRIAAADRKAETTDQKEFCGLPEAGGKPGTETRPTIPEEKTSPAAATITTSVKAGSNMLKSPAEAPLNNTTSENAFALKNKSSNRDTRQLQALQAASNKPEANTFTDKNKNQKPQSSKAAASKQNESLPPSDQSDLPTSEKLNRKESKNTASDKPALESGHGSRYQTAAKSQSPAVRSEASIQIQTPTPSTETRQNKDRSQTSSKQASIIQSGTNARASQPKRKLPDEATSNEAATTEATGTKDKLKQDAAQVDHKNFGSDKTNQNNAAATSTIANPTEKTADAQHSSTVTQNVSSIGIGANRSAAKTHAPNLKSVSDEAPNPQRSADISVSGKKSKNRQRKQTSIEVAVARQATAHIDNLSTSSTRQTSDESAATEKTNVVGLQDQNTHTHNKPESGPNSGPDSSLNARFATGADPEPQSISPGDSVLRAQLATSERRIKSLQSTLNSLQQNTSPPAPSGLNGSEKSHQRESLLSKVRILEMPRD